MGFGPRVRSAGHAAKEMIEPRDLKSYRGISDDGIDDPITCPVCGVQFDARDLGEVMRHAHGDAPQMTVTGPLWARLGFWLEYAKVWLRALWQS